MDKTSVNGLKGVVFLLLMHCLFSGCIRKEAPNAEADILSVTVDDLELLREPQITNTTVVLPVNGWTNITAITPTFVLTDGAKISPESGVAQDFTHPVKYTVTSEDGKWKKEYTVSVVPDRGVPEGYSFEYVREQGSGSHYHVFLNGPGEDATQEWESSNLGYAFMAGKDPAEKYPVHQFADGYQGKCVRLTTLSTGFFGTVLKKPIAAGSLFLGKLDGGSVLTDALKATRFGIPVDKKPLAMTGYYKYKAGDKFINKDNKEIKDRRDIFDFYAVFYEVTDEVPVLDGTNIKDHPNIVSVAKIEDPVETDEWTRFEVEFEMKDGKTVDAEKLARKGYNFTILMASSKGGDKFEGAVGSALLVDEVKVYFE